MFTHEDWLMVVSIAVGVLTVVVSAMLKWMFTQTHRQTGVEHDIAAMQTNRSEDWRRIEVAFMDFKSRLIRIEDALNKKVDK